MNKNKRFILVGILSLAVLVGCSAGDVQTGTTLSLAPNNEENSQYIDEELIDTTGQDKENDETNDNPINSEDESSNDEDINDEKVNDVKSMLNLKLLLGEKSDKVRQMLGEPKESKQLEETNILLADYYTKEVLKQKVTVEVVYDDEENKVNFVNMKCVQTDDVEEFVRSFDNELTNEFGEGTIEKTIDVRGTKSKEWGDGVLTYVLKYVETDVTLNIYPIHE